MVPLLRLVEVPIPAVLVPILCLVEVQILRLRGS